MWGRFGRERGGLEAAGSFRPRDAAKLTLPQVVAAVPCLCLLLLALGSGAGCRASGRLRTAHLARGERRARRMRAMPRYQALPEAWVLAAQAMLGHDVESLARRSPQYARYKQNLARAEL